MLFTRSRTYAFPPEFSIGVVTAVTLSLRIPSGHARPMCKPSPLGHVAVTTQPSGQTDPSSYVPFCTIVEPSPFQTGITMFTLNN